jgi:HD-like signal output (HDOD) protein
MKSDMSSIIECIEHLPVLPAITVRLVHVLNDKAATIEQVLEVVQFDQNLTLQILKLCNSAYFGLIRKIRSLREAVAYLGSRNIMQIVLGIHCNALLQQPRKGYGMMAGMLWRHSAACALASERFVPDSERNDMGGGLLFTAGLLHDVGKVILDQVLAENYTQVLDLLASRPMRFDEAEREVLGYSHAEVGELVMQHWKFPPEIAAVARYHHDPNGYDGGDRETRRVIDLVHLGDCLVLSLGIGVGNDGLQYQLDNTLAERYGLGAENLDQISAQVVDGLRALEQMYQEK